MGFWIRTCLLLWGGWLLLIGVELLIIRQQPSEARLIAHSDFWDGDSDIHLRVPGSQHNLNLTHTPGVETHPTWSPDGEWIAFVSDQDTPPGKRYINRVYVMRRDGSDLRRIGLSSPATGTRVIEWSPKGGWLYTKYITQGWWDSYFARLSDSHNASLRFDTTFTNYASWSPNGAGLAYRTGMFDDPQTALGIATPSNGQVAETQVLFTSREYIDYLSWSPDSQWIAFTTQARTQPEQFSLYRIRSDGNDVQQLHTGPFPYQQIVWSPDSQSLDFLLMRDAADYIYQIDLASGNVEAYPLIERAAIFRHLAWSPDGKWLAWVELRQDQNDIYRMRADGSQIEFLYRIDEPVFRLEWSGDGKRILFVAGQREQGQVYWMHPDGNEVQYLTDVAFDWDIPVSPIIDSAWRGWLILLTGSILLTVGVIRPAKSTPQEISANLAHWLTRRKT
jgi:TolB protein